MAGGEDAALSGGSTKAIPLNVKAGLAFPVGKTARLLEDGNYAPRFDATTPVYLATVLEYLAADLLDLAGHAAKRNNSSRIESQHLDMAVKGDEEFIKLLRNLKSATSLGDCGGENDDTSYDFYNSDDDDISIPSDDDELDLEEDDYDGDDEAKDQQVQADGGEQQTNAHVQGEEGASLTIGQMSVAVGRVELYRSLVDQFGEIVSPNISKFKVEHTCLALNELLNVVANIIEITPTEVSEELVSDWEDMASFYSGIGLKLDWFFDRIHRYRDWLVRRLSVDLVPLARKLVAKGDELEAKRKEIISLESEMQVLSTKFEKAQLSHTQFGFSFFDEV